MEAAKIKRFFNKQCTAAEAEEVAAYLKTNPSALEDYLSEKEWQNAVLQQNISEETWNKIWRNINSKNKRKLVLLNSKRVAVAACAIFIICSACYFYLTLRPKNNTVKPASSVSYTINIQEKKVTNTSATVINIFLQDSSIIKLKPKSSVEYSVPFQKNKREIYLKGEAYFKVSKNKLKPFIVYAANLSTTALGTSFTISTNKKPNSIDVKLYTGKVVIAATKENLKGWKNDIYLTPGQELSFNSNKGLLALKNINDISLPGKPLISTAKNKTEKDSVAGEISFNNTLLPQVMQTLSASYHVSILYDTALLNTMNFSGKISKNDSLPVLLKAIAEMNNLQVIKENGDYIIKPQ